MEAVADQESVQPMGEGRWLKPTEALNHYSPLDREELVARDAKESMVRFGFRVAGIGFLIGEGTGTEIVPYGTVSPVPNGPDWLQGLVNLRGSVIPVIDLGRALGADIPRDSDKTRAMTGLMVLVFDKGDKAIGVVVSELPKILKHLTTVDQLPPLPERISPHVTKGFLQENQLWIEFRHGQFFDSLVGTGASA